MMGKQFWLHGLGCFVIGFLAAESRPTQAQDAPKLELPKESFEKTAARAKASGRPLVVFGMTDTCSRCQAVKDALANTPEYKLLLAQYEFSQIPFGGTEFGQVFGEIVRRDKSIPPTIGAPSVFIFTSKGDTVYAGPNRESGIDPADELKKLLIAGLDKNGGIRPPATTNTRAKSSLAADVRAARDLISKNDLAAAAQLLAKHLQPDSTSHDEQVKAVIQLTGLQLVKSNDEQAIEQLVNQIAERIKPITQSAMEAAGTEKGVVGAVKLTELSHDLAPIPSLAGVVDAAWKEFHTKSGDPKLAEQAQLIVNARAAEKKSDPMNAIQAYRMVITTYPDTQAAKLSQQRIDQLQPKEPAPERQWKSKSGKFTVTAALVSFDGTTARLKSRDGRTLSVPVQSLSAEDQAFLQSTAAKK